MKTLYALLISLILAAGFGLAACQRPDKVEAAGEPDATRDRATALTPDLKEFTDYAAEMHSGEIMLAQFAKQESSSNDVKNYANAVINTHTEALEDLSNQTEQTRTSQATAASTDTQRHADYLSPLTGATFDREFIDLMIADHKDAVNTFKAQLDVSKNRPLMSYMKVVVPKLENRLREAERIQGTFKAKTD